MKTKKHSFYIVWCVCVWFVCLMCAGSFDKFRKKDSILLSLSLKLIIIIIIIITVQKYKMFVLFVTPK